MRLAISYRRVDSSETLERLERALRERFGAENVYKDLTTNKLGEPWIGDWVDAYANADVTLVVIGPHWAPERLEDKRDAVRLEIWGAQMQGVPLVPVLIDGAVMPEVRRLPRFLRSLPWRQGFVIDPQRTEEGIAELLERLEHDTQPRRSARQRLLAAMTRRATPSIAVDLSGAWEWTSAPKLLHDISMHQERVRLRMHAVGIDGDEVSGEGMITVRDGQVYVYLGVTSKQYGPLGQLLLHYEAEADVLEGKRMPALPLWRAVFKRKPVRLERGKMPQPMACMQGDAGRRARL